MAGSVMDLLDRAEGATRVSPAALGRMLGLGRAPEVKTIRRKLGELAAIGRADQLIMALARHHATAGELLPLRPHSLRPRRPGLLRRGPRRPGPAGPQPGEESRRRAGAAPG